MMKRIKNNSGFAMLFTVLVVSLILAISISISNVTFKQTLLSSLAKDSQIAFYEADAAMECAFYYDFTEQLFPLGTPLGNAPEAIRCGTTDMRRDDSESYDDYFVYKPRIDDSALPCYTIFFDKTNSPLSLIRTRGYNTCNESPRQVERVLEVQY